jgi:hypothetical protein
VYLWRYSLHIVMKHLVLDGDKVVAFMSHQHPQA